VIALRPLVLTALLASLPARGFADDEPRDAMLPEGLAIHVGKLVTMDDEDSIHQPGVIVIEDGKIVYVGGPAGAPRGYRVLEYPDAWAIPGMVDLHTHIMGGGRDINDMVRAVNPELRVSACLQPGNPRIDLACASGITTLFGIPGSGTNMGGFGVLYKTKTDSTYDGVVIADPGGLKVAQDSNPQRRNATDFGVSRAGQAWNLTDVNDRAVAALEQGRFDLALEDLKRVHTKELPVLIHTAGSDGAVNTARMWRETYDTRSVLSHGSFDGWKVAEAVARYGIPVNHGPRTMDWFSSRNGRINGSAAEYAKAVGRDFSLNTDSGVVAEEQFFLQGAMAARYGGDPYEMLRALTINPAKTFGIDDRVGSLEPGKDADIVIRRGDPMDPRGAVELVLIDGVIQYDRRDGQWF